MPKFVGFNMVDRPNSNGEYENISNGVYINPEEIVAIRGYTNKGGKWSVITLKNGVEFEILGDSYHMVKQAGIQIEGDRNA